MAIEALTYLDLRAQVVMQYEEEESSKRLPGQVYLMMVLQVCHALYVFKLDDATEKLQAMSLAYFPGESVSKFTNESQHLINIMMGSYALPVSLNSV